MNQDATHSNNPDIHFDLPYARIEQVQGREEPYQNHLEVRQAFPGAIGLYLRVNGGIGNFGSGVKRDMLGCVNLETNQVEALRDMLSQWLILQ